MPYPHRGDRRLISVRVPVTILDRVDHEASREGLSRSDYVTRWLALQHGVDVPDYIHPVEDAAQPRLDSQGERMSA